MLLCALAFFRCGSVYAWGDEGHEVVGLIAEHFLTEPVRARVQALLAGDRSGLTADTSMASESSWADRYRDSDRRDSRQRYEHTYRWHFIDLELAAPDLRQACFGYPTLGARLAFEGPARDCVVDKIVEFRAELADAHTRIDERRLALQFLLHFVGDIHQPLHAADDHDEGGNRERVFTRGHRGGSLHAYWDTALVESLDQDPQRLAATLIARLSESQVRAWQQGEPADWALESFGLARTVAYGELPPPTRRGDYRLSPRYTQLGQQVVAEQLSRAGVRLAGLLNRALR